MQLWGQRCEQLNVSGDGRQDVKRKETSQAGCDKAAQRHIAAERNSPRPRV